MAAIPIAVEINSRFFVFKHKLILETVWTKNKDDTYFMKVWFTQVRIKIVKNRVLGLSKDAMAEIL